MAEECRACSSVQSARRSYLFTSRSISSLASRSCIWSPRARISRTRSRQLCCWLHSANPYAQPVGDSVMAVKIDLLHAGGAAGRRPAVDTDVLRHHCRRASAVPVEDVVSMSPARIFPPRAVNDDGGRLNSWGFMPFSDPAGGLQFLGRWSTACPGPRITSIGD